MLRMAQLALPLLLVATPNNSERCKMIAADIQLGVTRADVMKLMRQDGGVNGIYHGERHNFLVSFVDEGGFAKACKLLIDFRPKGVSEDIYNDPDRFSKWMAASRPRTTSRSPETRNDNLLKKIWRTIEFPFRGHRLSTEQVILLHGAPTDEVVRISAPYLEAFVVD